MIRRKGVNTIEFDQLNENIQRTLFISIRESLQNTLKYANASRFLISFSKKKDSVQLMLEDNGSGFEEKIASKGIGLKNLQERIQELKGTFVISSSENGTITEITLPLYG